MVQAKHVERIEMLSPKAGASPSGDASPRIAKNRRGSISYKDSTKAKTLMALAAQADAKSTDSKASEDDGNSGA
jgi:hypothetical protein